MRVLSISHRMQHPLVDNHSIFNAPAINDYEAIVIDSGGVSDSIRQAVRAETAFTSFAGTPVANGESTDEFAGLADLLQRRREECTRALEQGAVIAVFAHAPARVGGVDGFHGLERYFFLPAPAGAGWDTDTLKRSEGDAVSVTEPDHPFARVIDVIRNDLMYRVVINERAPGIAGNLRAFIRSAGGAIVGAELRVLNGRVVFLPAPRRAGERRVAASLGQATVDAMLHILELPGDSPPAWVDQTEVPGLPELEAAVDAARLRVEQAEADLEATQLDAAERRALRDVLWAANEHTLAAGIDRCLSALGFERSETDDSSLLFAAPEGELHVVADGATGAVDMSPHYRLRARLDRLIERGREAPNGLVIANGRRNDAPQRREDEFSDSLRVAAEATGYALLTARWLFVLAVAAIEGLPADAIAEARRRLIETRGVVQLEDLLLSPGLEESASTPAASDGAAGADAGDPAEARPSSP